MVQQCLHCVFHSVVKFMTLAFHSKTDFFFSYFSHEHKFSKKERKGSSSLINKTKTLYWKVSLFWQFYFAVYFTVYWATLVSKTEKSISKEAEIECFVLAEMINHHLYFKTKVFSRVLCSWQAVCREAWLSIRTFPTDTGMKSQHFLFRDKAQFV